MFGRSMQDQLIQETMQPCSLVRNHSNLALAVREGSQNTISLAVYPCIFYATLSTICKEELEYRTNYWLFKVETQQPCDFRAR